MMRTTKSTFFHEADIIAYFCQLISELGHPCIHIIDFFRTVLAAGCEEIDCR